MEKTFANFWIRILAFVIDLIVLGLFGIILGLAFKNFFISIDYYSFIIGFAIFITYFSIGYSKLTKGQTIGKKILNISVIDKNGNFLNIFKAFIRALIISLAFFAIKLQLPNNSKTILILAGIKIFGIALISAITFLYIFNKYTRQSLHDLLTKTFVVKTSEIKNFTYNTYYIKPWTYIFTIFLVILISYVYGSFYFKNYKKYLPLIQIEEKLETLNNVQNAKVYVNELTIYSTKKIHVKSLIVILYLQKLPHITDINEMEKLPLTKKIISIILTNYKDIQKLDKITIKFIYGFNLGIAQAHKTFFISEPIDDWQNLIQSSNK